MLTNIFKPSQNVRFLLNEKFFFFFFLQQSLALFSRLECNDTTRLTATSASWVQAVSASQVAVFASVRCHTWLIFVLLVEMRFHHVGHAGLKRLTSGDPPTSAFQGAGITGTRHHAQLIFFVILVETGFHHVDQDGLD
uniref:Uncharacterized protein n=1 Tax=Callithrix jacchus TaxID=9483 RepID=A0A8I3VUW9_CALJA